MWSKYESLSRVWTDVASVQRVISYVSHLSRRCKRVFLSFSSRSLSLMLTVVPDIVHMINIMKFFNDWNVLFGLVVRHTKPLFWYWSRKKFNLSMCDLRLLHATGYITMLGAYYVCIQCITLCLRFWGIWSVILCFVPRFKARTWTASNILDRPTKLTLQKFGTLPRRAAVLNTT